MRNVEENVVKMRFDNQDFDNNVEHSEKTLNSFKTSLLALPSEVALGLSNILSKINLADILGFAGVIAGINLVRNAIGGIGDTIESVVNRGMAAVSSLMQQTYAQIKSGGMQRALNIEAAKFQIAGLKLDVETFMEAADYAVSGTAYSLDAAAKAASQLGASGVTSLEELKKALRGVSGVAAMTNSDYESIAHVFTTVAGNGRLMTEQLNSLSSRGINAAAVLADAYGKTEAELRDMVSKGKVSFKMFYEAMDDAFGEHAKDANKTFTGAMSNIRAALSRIGEAFATPYIQNMIGVYNELRLTINAIKNELGENKVFEFFSQTVEKVTDRLQKLIGWIKDAVSSSTLMVSIGEAFGKVTNFVDKLTYALKPAYGGELQQIFNNVSRLVTIVKDLFVIIDESIEEVFGLINIGSFLNNTILNVLDLSKSLVDIFNENAPGIKETIVSFLTAIKEISETFFEILGINKNSLADIFTKASKKILEIFKNLKLTDNEIDNIKRTARGIFSIADTIKMLIVSIYNFIKPIFGYVRPIIDWILEGAAYIGDMLYNFRNIVKEERIFDQIFEKITFAIEKAKEAIHDIKENFFEAFFGDAQEDDSFLTKVKKFLTETINDVFDNINAAGIDLEPVKLFLNDLLSLGLGKDDEEEAEDEITFIESIMTKVKEGFGKVKEFFNSDFLNIDWTKFSEDGGAFIESFGAGIGSIFTGLGDFVEKFPLTDLEALGAMALIWHALDILKDIILGFFEFVLQLATIIITSGIDDKVLNFVSRFFEKSTEGVLKGLFSKIEQFMEDIKSVDFVELIHGREPKANIYAAIAEIIKNVCYLLVAIAASLAIIADIPASDLYRAIDTLMMFVLTIGAIFAAMFILFKAIDGINLRSVLSNNKVFELINLSSGGTTPFDAFARGLKNMAIMIVAIAASLYIVVKADAIGDVWKAAAIIGIFIVAIAAIFLAFAWLESHIGSVGRDIQKIGTAFLFVGVAAVLVASAIKKIVKVTEVGREGDVWRAFGVISLTLVVIGAILGVVAAFNRENSGGLLVTGIAMLLMSIGMAIAISKVADAIRKLSKIPPEELSRALDVIEFIGIILAVVTIVLSIIGGVIGVSEVGIIGVLVLFGSIAVCLALIAVVAVAAAAGMLAAVKLINTYRDLMMWCKDLDDSEIERITSNFQKLIVGMASAVPYGIEAWFNSAKIVFKEMFPKLLEFFQNDSDPFLFKLAELLFPDIGDKILEGLKNVFTLLADNMPLLLSILEEIIFGMSPGQGLMTTIQVWSDRIWDDTVKWLHGRIPVVVPDIFMLILDFIKAINAALDENWEEFDKELQHLIDSSISLMKELLTGEKTSEDLKNMLGEVIDSISGAITDNMPKVVEALKNMGKEGLAAFVDALTGKNDQTVSEKLHNLIVGMFNLEDYNTTITMDLDYSNVTSGINDIQNSLSGLNSGNNNVIGIGDANNLPLVNQLLNQQNLQSLFPSRDNSIVSDINFNMNANVDKDKLIKYEYDYTKKQRWAGVSSVF